MVGSASARSWVGGRQSSGRKGWREDGQSAEGGSVDAALLKAPFGRRRGFRCFSQKVQRPCCALSCGCLLFLGSVAFVVLISAPMRGLEPSKKEKAWWSLDSNTTSAPKNTYSLFPSVRQQQQQRIASPWHQSQTSRP